MKSSWRHGLDTHHALTAILLAKPDVPSALMAGPLCHVRAVTVGDGSTSRKVLVAHRFCSTVGQSLCHGFVFSFAQSANDVKPSGTSFLGSERGGAKISQFLGGFDGEGRASDGGVLSGGDSFLGGVFWRVVRYDRTLRRARLKPGPGYRISRCRYGPNCRRDGSAAGFLQSRSPRRVRTAVH